MILNLKNITFVIVSYKSENVIFKCINSLPKKSKIIVVENSENHKLKKQLLSKYDNIKVIINKNIGMGAGNNIGIKKSNTQYVFILNPDTRFKKDTFKKLIDAAKSINDFGIISPLNSNLNYPNYDKNNSKIYNKNILNVECVDGFSMLINKKKIKNQEYFDKNFFLYLENVDLCKRVRKSGEKIFVIKNSLINHLGGSSTNKILHDKIEYLRNWHWMWSKFYYSRKHYGYLIAIFNISSNLISSIFKILFYLFIFNEKKGKIYKMRFLGILNGLLCKKSWLRLKNIN